MDVLLDYTDDKFFTPYIYPVTWRPDEPLRQLINLFLITNVGGALLYLSSGTISFFLLFDRELMKHPQFLEVLHFMFEFSFYFWLIIFSLQDQVKREIKYTLWSVPWISLPTVALFFLEVRGYSKLYDKVDHSPGGKFGCQISCWWIMKSLLVLQVG